MTGQARDEEEYESHSETSVIKGHYNFRNINLFLPNLCWRLSLIFITLHVFSEFASPRK